MEPGKQTASADEAMKHEEPRQSAGAHAARAAAGSDPGRDACGGEVLPTELCSGELGCCGLRPKRRGQPGATPRPRAGGRLPLAVAEHAPDLIAALRPLSRPQSTTLRPPTGAGGEGGWNDGGMRNPSAHRRLCQAASPAA
jgi:hypothetical protein